MLIQLFIKFVNALVAGIIIINDPLSYFLITKELNNLYSAPSIIRMIKLNRIGWAGHVARMGAKRNAH
jgi:hypothetical protein